MFPIANMPRIIQHVTLLIPVALLSRDRARHLPQGQRLRILAAGDDPAGVGVAILGFRLRFRNAR
jgi:hypothetical protein